MNYVTKDWFKLDSVCGVVGGGGVSSVKLFFVCDTGRHFQGKNQDIWTRQEKELTLDTVTPSQSSLL